MIVATPITAKAKKISFRKYYSEGETLAELNVDLIKLITDYILEEDDPQVIKEAVDVIRHITSVFAASDILKFVIMYEDMNSRLFNFLVKSIHTVYN